MSESGKEWKPTNGRAKKGKEERGDIDGSGKPAACLSTVFTEGVRMSKALRGQVSFLRHL